jgi:drug/metabolite transporter (DMT)-like permease
VRRVSLLRFVLLSAIWGSSFLFIKVALEGLAPAQVVAGRVWSGALVLLAVVALRRLALPRSLRLWGHLVLLALLANVVPFMLFSWAETHVDSSVAGLLNGATPLITIVLATVLLPEERATATRVVGLLLGFVGVVAIIGPWRPGVLSGEGTGQLACIGAAACYGLAITWTRRHVSDSGLPLLVLAAAQLGAAAVIMLLLAPFVATDPMQLDLDVVGAVLTLGVLGTGLAYLLYYALIRDVGATTASMVTYLIPVVAVALGVAVLGEDLHWNVFVGAAIVIGGVALAEGRFGGAGDPSTTEMEAPMPLPATGDE